MIRFLAGINLDIQNALLFVAILGLVWAFFLFIHRRGNLQANRFLGVLIAVLATFLLRRIAVLDSDSLWLYVYFISHGFIFLIGPSVYFYFYYFTGLKAKKLQLVKHYIPSVLAIGIMSVLFFFRQWIDRLEDLSTLKQFSIFFIGLQVVHILGYLYYSRKLVSAYAKRCESYYSSLSRINLKWIKQLMTITSVFGAGILVLSTLIITGGYYEINNAADTLFLILTASIIASIVVKSWKQPEIISGLVSESGKYKNSPLTEQDLAELQVKLEQLLEKERTYLTQELNLSQLAEMMDTQAYLLSQLLNEKYGKNFFNFINGHRIDFAKQKIQDGYLSSRTLEAIAYESGFNSKSTFNRAFKKKVGCSPKEFHQSIKERTSNGNGQ